MKKFQVKPQGMMFDNLQQYQGGANEDMKHLMENAHIQTEESLCNPF